MAEPKVVYPIIPQQTWWRLRQRFLSSVPAQVTPSYLRAVLEISEKTAKDNVIPTLKRLGLLGKDGKPTELARRWRDDQQYPSVAHAIRDSIYPQELRDAVPDPVQHEDAAYRWFIGTGVGEAAARAMAKTYRLLHEADPSPPNRAKAAAAPSGEKSGRKRPAAPEQKGRSAPTGQRSPAAPEPGAPPAIPAPHRNPSLHLDIQVHISPAATPEQIDAIFASMAKHLYGRD